MSISPRPFGQVLGDAVNSLGRSWKPLATTALLVFLPIGVITLVVFHLSGATEFLDLVFNDPEYLQNLGRDAFLDEARPFLIASGIAILIQGLGALFVYVTSHRIVAKDLGGLAVSGGEARRHAFTRVPTTYIAAFMALIVLTVLFGAGLIVWLVPAALVGTPNFTSVLIAGVLFVALLAPGMWVLVSLSMLTSVVSLENRGPLGSLTRSYRLVKGRWWATLGFLLMVGLLGFVATQLIQIVAIPLSLLGDLGMGVSLASLLGVIAQGLIVAAIGATYTMWYVDLRSRKEELTPADLN